MPPYSVDMNGQRLVAGRREMQRAGNINRGSATPEHPQPKAHGVKEAPAACRFS